MSSFEIIRKPRITEKTVYLQNAENVYTFEVDPRANRTQIKDAVEKFFGVKVLSVQTMNCTGPKRRVGRSSGFGAAFKKAMVKLAEGQKIEGV